jgi:hypothetical protein
MRDIDVSGKIISKSIFEKYGLKIELDRSNSVYSAVAGICGHSSETACCLKHSIP